MTDVRDPRFVGDSKNLLSACHCVSAHNRLLPFFLAPVIGGHQWNCQHAISHRKIAICTLQTDKQMECPAIKSSETF